MKRTRYHSDTGTRPRWVCIGGKAPCVNSWSSSSHLPHSRSSLARPRLERSRSPGPIPALRSGPPAIAQVAHSPKAVAFMGARKCVATKTSASSIAESQRRRRVCQHHSALPSAGIRELPPHHSQIYAAEILQQTWLTDLREKLSPFYSDIGRPPIDSELMLRMLIGG